jgi:hypothetical protein
MKEITFETLKQMGGGGEGGGIDLEKIDKQLYVR